MVYGGFWGDAEGFTFCWGVLVTLVLWYGALEAGLADILDGGLLCCFRGGLVMYSMNRCRLAIYRVGGVGNMRHLKWGWGQQKSGIGM